MEAPPRRRPVRLLALTASLCGAVACAPDSETTGGGEAEVAVSTPAERGGARLAVPVPHEVVPLGPGVHRLDVSVGREALLYVPPSVDALAPTRLVVSYHGAGGRAADAVGLLRQEADQRAFVIVAPSSEAATWDVIARGSFGPDVEATQLALEQAARHVAVDSASAVVAGFSDGASYALSLGLSNGDRFAAVLAFSPGFAAPTTRRGYPRVFISHGTDDRVLPIDRTSRVLAARLRDDLELTYVEFDGGHEVPQEMRERALDSIAW